MQCWDCEQLGLWSDLGRFIKRMETMKQSDREAVKLDEALSSLLGTCIYTGGCVFTLVGRYNEISTLKLNLILMDHLPKQ